MLWCPVSSRYRIVLGYRVSLSLCIAACTARHRGVMNAWNLSMDAAPMINRACASYRTRGPFLSKRKGRKEERGYAATRERLPSTSSYRVHRDPASLTNRLPFLHTQRASSRDGPGIRDRGFLKIVCQLLPPSLLSPFLFFSSSISFHPISFFPSLVSFYLRRIFGPL